VDAPALTVSGEQLRELVGAELPPSAWVAVTRAQLERFDASTYDGPSTNYGGARSAEHVHGTYSVALLVPLWERTVGVTGPREMVLYGFERVRFPAPVRLGDRVRARFSVQEVTAAPAGMRYRVGATLEIEGRDRPGAVAELVFHLPG
jgi:acyl dehydratase